MASPEAAYLTTLYQSLTDRLAANPAMDLPGLRDLLEGWHVATREPEGVTYAEVDAGGVDAMWVTPHGAAPDRVLLYFHGGGWMVCSMHSHRKLVGHLAKAAGVRALILDYRLAPEHPFPAQIDDGVAAYEWLLGQGISPDHIATAGDSAGGNLAVAVVLRLRELGLALPAAIVALSPGMDLELGGETMESRAETDVLISRALVEGMVGAYLGGVTSPKDPLANPLCADLSGLPPTYVEAGDHEMLLDHSTRFAALSEAAGNEVVLVVAPEMQHVFHVMAGRAPEADAAVAAIGAWLRPKLGLA